MKCDTVGLPKCKDFTKGKLWCDFEFSVPPCPSKLAKCQTLTGYTA